MTSQVQALKKTCTKQSGLKRESMIWAEVALELNEPSAEVKQTFFYWCLTFLCLPGVI